MVQRRKPSGIAKSGRQTLGYIGRERNRGLAELNAAIYPLICITALDPAGTGIHAPTTVKAGSATSPAGHQQRKRRRRARLEADYGLGSAFFRTC